MPQSFNNIIITKPHLFIFQKNFEDRPTDNTTYKDASASRRLKIYGTEKTNLKCKDMNNYVLEMNPLLQLPF